MSRFGKVAVLYGGWSDERAVSLDSGASVHAALLASQVDATLIDASPERILRLRDEGYDRVFIALHGRGGEDGQTQAVLDLLGLPYTGSGMAASAVAMDKLLTKQIWQACGLPTPAYRVLHSVDDAHAAAADLGLPLFIKPAREGSSVGLSRVTTREDIPAAYARAARQDSRVLAEQGIEGGGEYTAALLGDQALPLIQIIPANAYYDYAAKYELDTTQYRVPEDLGAERTQALQSLAQQAFTALDGHGWGRIDLLLDTQQQPWLIEANMSPGMTSHSLVPMAAKAAGLDFTALVLAILEQTLPSAGGVA